ncbi:MAG TPA: DUF721 domain-containing protein [Thermodesulfobacteriota bacterium]|nr:DUF721 domain-containing protein [Thermodesulfobacteriota bacterium]
MTAQGPPYGKPPSSKRNPDYARRKRSSHPSKAGALIASALPHLGIDSRLREYNIKKFWGELVGEAVSRRAVPLRLMGRTLYCSVSSSTWMAELNYQKKLIIERINERLGQGAVEDIVLRQGAVPEPQPPAGPGADSREGKKRISPGDRAFIKKTTSGIKDGSLKAVIKRALEKSRQ